MKSYIASFSTNNNTTVGRYEYASKREAVKGIREICRGNTHAGCVGHVSVFDGFGNEVYRGTVK